jgi:hypothetical protein
LITKNTIRYYTKYVADILIIFNPKQVTEELILKELNELHKHLEFKLTQEEDNQINFLGPGVIRNTTHFDTDIYLKPTTTGTIIHSSSNHPIEHKLTAYRSHT